MKIILIFLVSILFTFDHANAWWIYLGSARVQLEKISEGQEQFVRVWTDSKNADFLKRLFGSEFETITRCNSGGCSFVVDKAGVIKRDMFLQPYSPRTELDFDFEIDFKQSQASLIAEKHINGFTIKITTPFTNHVLYNFLTGNNGGVAPTPYDYSTTGVAARSERAYFIEKRLGGSKDSVIGFHFNSRGEQSDWYGRSLAVRMCEQLFISVNPN